MLTIHHLTITDNTGKTLIDDLNLVINDTDRIAIIGEEGNGKSTLLKSILGMHLSYASSSGNIDRNHLNIGYLPQIMDPVWENSTPYEYCLKENVDEEIAFEAYNELSKVAQLCIQLHLPSDFVERETPIYQLSGGEKVKLMLVKVLMKPVDFLCLDEPTNDLDLETLIWLETFMKEFNHGILFISHDETLLENVATDILLLEQVNKKTKVRHSFYHGSYFSFLENRLHMIEKEEQLANKEKQEYLKKQQKLNDIMNSVHHYQNTITRQNPAKGRLLKKKMHALKSMEKRFEKEGYTKLDTLEEAIDVFFEPFDWNPNKIICELHYDRIQVENKTLIEDVDLFIKGNEKVVIIGNNGCGKTTLIQKIFEDLKDRGDLKIGYMPQTYSKNMDLEYSPLDYLAPNQTKEEITKAREMMGRMKFTRDEMIHQMKDLSEGQKAKLYLLRFILEECNVLILDEPTRNLSPLSNPTLRKMLIEFDGAILSISHDRKYIEEVCDTVYEIKDQRFIKRIVA